MLFQKNQKEEALKLYRHILYRHPGNEFWKQLCGKLTCTTWLKVCGLCVSSPNCCHNFGIKQLFKMESFLRRVEIIITTKGTKSGLRGSACTYGRVGLVSPDLWPYSITYSFILLYDTFMLFLFGTDNFHALVKFLHMLRWLGRLEEVLYLFEKCEAYSPTAVTEPGYNYCKGLYYWSVSTALTV